MIRSYTSTIAACLLIIFAGALMFWAALSFAPHPPVFKLKTSALLTTLLLLTASAALFLPIRAFREQERRITEFTEALDSRRRVANGLFPKLTFNLNVVIDELEKTRKEGTESKIASDRDERLSELGRFSAALAHEIRNPLTSIKGYADLLLEQHTEGELAEDLKAIKRDAERCDRLLEEVLNYARDPKLSRVAVTVNELAMVTRLDKIKVESEGGVQERFLGDKILLERVFENLITNAREAGATAIKIGASREGRMIRILLRDNGRGIPRAMLEKLFTPFASEKPQGTGLGLAICRKTIEAHGGEIIARNRPEGGAEFEIRLPIGEA